jgi:hypothetical protein
MNRTLLLAVLGMSWVSSWAATGEGWITLFNGRDLSGWKPSEENAQGFTVEDGTLKASGPRAHLYYVGADGRAEFTNFVLQLKVRTQTNANSGVYFHTAWQASGWPAKGFEAQVNSTHSDKKKTGGLYAVLDVMDVAPSTDGEWFDYEIRVEGRRVTLKVNGEVTAAWTQPDGWPGTKSLPGRVLDKGTIALQAHDPGSVVHYKDIRIRPLP